MKSKLHNYDQMTEWARSKPDADPSHEFYDYSELAFVKECQKQVRLSAKLRSEFPMHFKKTGIFRRIADAFKRIIQA